MTRRLSFANIELSRARDMVALGQSISQLGNGRIDPSDMYRAAIVQAVSAMDNYFHGVVIDKAVDMIMGRISVETSSNRNVGLTFDVVAEIIQSSDPVQRELSARGAISSRMSKETLQSDQDIAKALGMVGIGGIWGRAFGHSARAVKTSLGVVVTRRHRIVHQSDSDPLSPGQPTEICAEDTLAGIRSVEKVVIGIDPFC